MRADTLLLAVLALLLAPIALPAPAAASAGPLHADPVEVGRGAPACVSADVLERLRVHASYRPSGDHGVEVTAADVALDGEGGAPPAEAARPPDDSELFVYEAQSQGQARRHVTGEEFAVVVVHEAEAFESVANLLVLIPCGEPGSARVLERGFRVPIGRTFLYGMEPRGDDAWVLVGRNQGADASAFWGSVWTADMRVGGRLRLLARVGYSSEDTGTTLDVASFRYGRETEAVVLQLAQAVPGQEGGPSGREEPRKLELTVPVPE